jgi:ketosteroid isomerase-like protein
MLKSVLLMSLLPAIAAVLGKDAAADEDVARTIIAIERDALERGAKGDVEAFVKISDPDVVYFDPFLEQRLDGAAALKDYYLRVFKAAEEETDFELLNPKVQVAGEVAVLTFNFRNKGRRTGRVDLWNCTEVYRKTAQGWRIIQTHWSWTKPQLAAAQ